MPGADGGGWCPEGGACAPLFMWAEASGNILPAALRVSGVALPVAESVELPAAAAL